MPDPLALPQLPQLPGFGMPGQQQGPPPPTPEEQSSLLGKTMGAVGWLGSSLDKPGAAVRGLLAGQGTEALKNLIPFSDTMGITDPKQRVTGTDLLEQWGLLSPKDHDAFEWHNPSDWGRAAAGFATDVVTDPLTWIGGPLSKGMEKGASLAGKTVPEMAELANAGKLADVVSHTPTTFSAGLRSGDVPLATLHAPFWAEWMGAPKEPIAELSAKSFGGAAEPLANAAAAANDFIAYHTPVKYLRGLLSPSASGVASPGGSKITFDSATQVLNDLNYSTRQNIVSSWRNLMPAVKDAHEDLLQQFSELAEHHMANGDAAGAQAFQDLTKELVFDRGGIPDPTAIAGKLQGIMGITPNSLSEDIDKTAKLAEQMHQMLGGLRTGIDAARERVNKLGGNIGELQDAYGSYWPRRSSDAAAERSLGKLLNRRRGIGEDEIRPEIARDDAFRNIPGGDLTINKLAQDPIYMGFETAHDEAGNTIYQALPDDRKRAALQDWIETQGSAHGMDPMRVAELAPQNDAAAAKIPLDELRDEYARRNHIMPKLEDAWPNKAQVLRDPQSGAIMREADGVTPLGGGEVRTLNPKNAGGDKRDFTYDDERARWLKGDAMGDLREKLDAMSPETRRKSLMEEMKNASADERAAIQAQVDNYGGGVWQHGIFDRHVVDDGLDYLKHTAETESTLLSAHNFLAQPGLVGRMETPHTLAGTEAKPTVMPEGASLMRAWKDAGLQPGTAEKGDGLFYFAQQNAEKLGIPKETFDDPKKWAEAVGDLRLTPGAESALRSYGQTTSPRIQNAALDALDGLTGLYKRALYSMWPASYIRNLGSHTWQNWSTGKAPLLTMEEGKEGILNWMGQAYKYASKQGSEETPKGFLEEYSRLAGKGEAGATQMTEALGEKGAKSFESLPKGGLGWVLAGNTEEGGGVGGMAKRAWDTGPRAQQEVNFVVRGGYYGALRDQGYSSAQAMYLVKQSGFDYSELSSFERGVAKRMVPFWTFSARNVPYQFQKLFEQPGGITAQTIKGVAAASSPQTNPDVYTPSFLQEQNKMPVGETNPRAQSFFGTSMLPFSDLNDVVFQNGNPFNARTVEKPLSRLHPLALAPLELAAGKQVQTGRNIGDLESPSKAVTGTAYPVIDRAIHYSPLSRVVGEGWSLEDQRKTWPQALSGFLGLGRVGTYDTEAYKLRDMRDAMAGKLEQTPEVKQWTSYFLPKDAQATMEPEKKADEEFLIKRMEQMTKLLVEQRKAAMAGAQ